MNRWHRPLGYLDVVDGMAELVEALRELAPADRQRLFKHAAVSQRRYVRVLFDALADEMHATSEGSV